MISECDNEGGSKDWYIIAQPSIKYEEEMIDDILNMFAGPNTANWGATRSICWYFYLWGKPHATSFTFDFHDALRNIAYL